MRPAYAPLVSILALLAVVSAPSAATYTVLSPSDAGLNTLRWAIEQANATMEADRIVFNVLGGGPQSIRPLTPLPAIVHPLAIDGTTQPGYFSAPAVAGIPMIEVEGSGLVGPVPGFQFNATANGSSVRGLAINRFGGSGIFINYADNCTVAANHIGTDRAGEVALGNGDGVLAFGWNHVVGGADAKSRNILSGNGGAGVSFLGDDSGNFLLRGNYIGTDVDGVSAIPNGLDGVFVGTGGNIGGMAAPEGNVISGNVRHGIAVYEDNPDQLLYVRMNLIGTNAYGTGAIPNLGDGVRILAGFVALGTTTFTAMHGNTISGNGQHGVYIQGPGRSDVSGNYIGTTSDGTRALGNAVNGVHVVQSARAFIGGNHLSKSGNVIAANGNFGIYVTDQALETPAAIQGNFIGTNRSQSADLGNGGAGIWIDEGNAAIGSSNDYDRNVIAYNRGGGITLGSGTEVTMDGNSIFANFWAGIDLIGEGGPVTPNDPSDTDHGPNEYQNFPAITSVTYEFGQLRIQGWLSSTPSSPFRLTFYSNRACDPSGHGQGESIVGTLDVTTNGSGIANYDVTFFDPVAYVGPVFTATATTKPVVLLGNTSEFGPCYTMSSTPVSAEAPQRRFALGAAFPRPTQSTVNVPFSLAAPAHVRLRVYDVAGREVATLVNEERAPGAHQATWDGSGFAAGTYLLRFEAEARDGSGERFVSGGRVVILN